MIDVHADQRRQLRRACERMLFPLVIILLSLCFILFSTDRKAEASYCHDSGAYLWVWIVSYAICNSVMFIMKCLVYKFWRYGYEAAAQGVLVRSLESCYLIFGLLRFAVFIFASIVVFRATSACKSTRFYQMNIYLYIMLWFETVCPVYCLCLALMIFAFGILPMARLFQSIERGVNASDIASDPSRMTAEETEALEADVRSIPVWKYRYVPTSGYGTQSGMETASLSVPITGESPGSDDSFVSATSDSPMAAEGRAPRSAGKDEDDEPMCAICMMPYEEGEVVKKLPCGGASGGNQTAETRPVSPPSSGEQHCDRLSLYRSHHFHQECVDPWLKKKVTCPICRVQIPLPRFSEFVAARATELNNSRLRQILTIGPTESNGARNTPSGDPPTATRLHLDEENTTSVLGRGGEAARSSDSMRIHFRASSGSPREAQNRHVRTNPLGNVHADSDRSSADRVVVEILGPPNVVREDHS